MRRLLFVVAMLACDETPSSCPNGILIVTTDFTSSGSGVLPLDGIPDVSAIRIVGNQAFVALERLNPYPQSTQPSQVEVLDTTTFEPVTTIQLVGRNPLGLMVESNGKLWLAEPGNLASATETDA